MHRILVTENLFRYNIQSDNDDIEVQLKFMHRILVTKNKTFFVIISNQIMTIYIVAKRTLLPILLATAFSYKNSQEVITWFNVTNTTHVNSPMKEKLFGDTSEPSGKKINEGI